MKKIMEIEEIRKMKGKKMGEEKMEKKMRKEGNERWVGSFIGVIAWSFVPVRLFPIKLRTSPLEIIYNPNNEFIQRFSQKPSNAISEKIFHPLLS